MTTITERVAAGAAFLDERDPDWWRADVERAIDLEELDLGSARRCILGQRCPVEVYVDSQPGNTKFSAYAEMLSGIGAASQNSTLTSWAAALGFQMTQDETPMDIEGDEYDALTAEWTRVITERRAAA